VAGGAAEEGQFGKNAGGTQPRALQDVQLSDRGGQLPRGPGLRVIKRGLAPSIARIERVVGRLERQVGVEFEAEAGVACSHHGVGGPLIGIAHMTRGT
jgi:hypothetical protein